MVPPLSILTALLIGCGAGPSLCDEAGPAGSGENILVIVSDDIGVDKTAAYGEHPSPARTPSIDALAAQGVMFRNAYASPTCSPTRASILTGRQPSRHGIGRWIYADDETYSLPLDELTIPEALRHSPHPYISAAVGKWHLVGFADDSPQTHPLDQGFDCHAGSLGNPLEAVLPGHLPRGFRNWEKAIDGVVSWKRRYMTSDTTDEALARIERTRSPWFLYVNYNDAHDPLHIPPTRLRTDKLTQSSSDLELYEAMVEAADTEIGRLLDGIPDDILATTTIIYISDNGTPSHGISEPWRDDRGKATVYEGGVRVPLIVAGPHVRDPGSVSDALVHAVDLFPTIAELAEVDVEGLSVEEGDARGQPLELDGMSLLPWIEDPSLPSGRDYVYAEGFFPNGELARDYHQRTIRDAEWKLVWKDQGSSRDERFYYLDPGADDEGEDLLDAELTETAAAAFERLQGAMEDQLAALE